jgi:hypothetical protein
MKRLPNGEEYQPRCEESYCLWWVLFEVIRASHLNTLPVELSIKHGFGAELKREEIGWRASTSLSLFVDDVERLLRDLYRESDDKAINGVRRAVFGILRVLTPHLRNDLWQEHNDAENVDYVNGIGVPDGYGIGGSDHRKANRAARDLALRARAVRANPTAFSKYTVRFVEALEGNPRLLAAADSREELDWPL